MDSRHVKTINTDSRSKKRIRFASSKERSKKASADVYRSYKGRTRGGLTSAATRETSVHNPKKRHKSNHTQSTSGGKFDDRTSYIKISNNADNEKSFADHHLGLESINNSKDFQLEISTNFSIEVDVAYDRNASEIFAKFHREIWILIRSLPEILHNLDKIIDLLMSYMLSPASIPERPTPPDISPNSIARTECVINHATTDILHLLSVLARDLRHEIHPYLHTKILPRVLKDLLNPPPPQSGSTKQPIPLEVTIVETAFRTLSYIFRYDSNLIANEMESMRKYYGITLGHRRELIRRLSAETFAPQIRKIKSHSVRERHIRRVLRALASTTSQEKSRFLQRTQMDAVGGISNLLFELIKGVPGKFHSQGGRIFKFILEYSCRDSSKTQSNANAKNDDDLVHRVVSDLLTKLFYHFSTSGFDAVCLKLFELLFVSIEKYIGCSMEEEEKSEVSFMPIIKSLKMLVQVATARSGNLLRTRSDDDLDGLFTSISKLCSGKFLQSLPQRVRCTLISSICQIWIPLQEKQSVNIEKNIQRILELQSEHFESIHPLSLILAKDLVPRLIDSSIQSAAVSKLLSTSALIAKSNPIASLEIVFEFASSTNLLSSNKNSANKYSNRNSFELFDLMSVSDLMISQEDQKLLIDACMTKFEDEDKSSCTQMSFNIRCAPFLATLNGNIEIKTYKRIADWLMECSVKSSSLDSIDTNIIKGLAIEAFSFLTLKAAEFIQTSVTKKSILRFKTLAGDLVSNCNHSLWIMRGVASFISVLKRFNLGPLINDTESIFDSLLPNLRSASHFLRLYSLQILSSYPKKMFVIHHADLDLDDDLDEEKGYHPPSKGNSNEGGPIGPCDLIEVLLKLESSPVRLEDERQIVVLIGKIEILARTQRLPTIYAETAANYMLGIFNIKFAPIWRCAEKALLSLLAAHEEIVWPSFESKLVDVMKGNISISISSPESSRDSHLTSKEKIINACRRWEVSNGQDISPFEASLSLVEGEVPCYHRTNAETVMESVWKVAAKGHRVVAKHSRRVVPLFLSFLHQQYFALNPNDQDARELHLSEFIEKRPVTIEKIPRFLIQKRLKSFLSTFSAIEGPKQLVHHQLLEKIFRAFLSHPDVTIVGYCISCLMKFKFEYLTPYHRHIQEMIQKGKLRNSLINLSEIIEEGKMNTKDRLLLLPILSRILFGRVAAKSGNSSNDSPTSRRAAVLSFMSIICKEEKDFFPFLYLMTRCFLPITENLNLVESYEANDRSHIMKLLVRPRSVEMASLPSPVIEGFLHLLHGVLSQFGHHVISWIPQLTGITIEICEFVKVSTDLSITRLSETKNDAEKRQANTESIRRSSIRTLCFQRLCKIFSLFGSSLDFTSIAGSMWSAMQPSLKLLPEMVIRNDGCPAILNLLLSLSADGNLIKVLGSNDHAVNAVVKCISGTSKASVIQVSLTFVENLLNLSGEDPSGMAKDLVYKFTPLLIKQFTMRLDGNESHDVVGTGVSHRKVSLKNSPTWRRELQILFCICELFSFNDWQVEKDEISFLETLCNLLIPCLEPSNGTFNEDKTNVVGILNGIVGKLKPELALMVFWRLSSVLAPNRARVGIEALPIRYSIANLMDMAAEKNPKLKTVSAIVLKLLSVNKKLVDEIDFEIVVPELLSLADVEKITGTWNHICTRSDSDPDLLTPIINVCFHFLHNEDGVISRASFNAIKALILVASSCIHEDNENAKTWMKMVESIIAPLSKSGLQSKDTKIRRYYILLIRELASNFRDIPSSNLCGDLGKLCNEENHDLDFFFGITHVQIHRRARAFQKLRKTLFKTDSDESQSVISSHSLSNILLPIALHPIYECKMRSEEGFVLDSIATLGAIARNLSWNKYNDVLWLVLNQFDRYVEQERYSVGALCAIIDGFNFELTRNNEAGSGPSEVKTSVWFSLEKRIIPKLEGLLSQDTIGKNGDRGKTIRPAIVLALVKLFKKFPDEFLDTKLPSILAVICDALRNKDSTARDVARNTLAKMVCSIDMKYLGDVIREVAITLNEGYKLHVRAATIHTILLQLLNEYEPSLSKNMEEINVPFDDCTAAIMELIQDDLFGVANERRESRENNVRFVREAGGSKSVHSVEMLCKMITFVPLQARNGKQSRSAIHCIICPLLERLRLPDIDTKTIRKVKEILSRVAIGISNNKTLKGTQLFPFVYATIQPFIVSGAITNIEHDEDEIEEEDDDGLSSAIKISGGRNRDNSIHLNHTKTVANVVEWRPSTMNSAESSRSAVIMKNNSSQLLKKVQDGVSAPKLTGSSRHNMLETFDVNAINEPATITAIVFGLNLMNSCLKKLDIRDEKSKAMLDPFVPMLTTCVCHCRDTEVALVALKCLLVLLRSHLPSIPSCSKSIGSKTLTLLTSAGSSLNTNHDLTQACFKTLTHLIGTQINTQKICNEISVPKLDSECGIEGGLPLNTEQMKVLISHIRASITDTDQHNPALSLIKVILIRRFLSPELYDLMECLMKLVVRSPKALLRQECAKLFVRYLLDYPMGDAAFEKHLKQIVANISYEYEEGRMSGIMLLNLVVEKMPLELVQRHAQHIFLPLVLQLVNDDSKDCRAEVLKCIILLLKRSSTELLQTFQAYCSRWSNENGSLRLASLQVFGIFVDCRSDFIKSSSLDLIWIQNLEKILLGREELSWETTYFSLVCIEKLLKEFRHVLMKQSKLIANVIECFIDPHPWIKKSSSRILNNILISKSAMELLSQKDGMLFEIVRNTLSQFNVSEEEQSQDLSDLGIKTLAFALPLMAENPRLCYAKDNLAHEESTFDDGRDPVFWLLRRLSQIVKTKGSKRRMTVFKCYAAFVAGSFDIVSPHLKLMLEGLHRSSIEAKNEIENRKLSSSSFGSSILRNDNANTEHNFAEEVLGLIEEKCCSSSDFVTAYAEVKRRAYHKKQQRKIELKAEAVQHPEIAAERRMKKQERNKERKKRRSEEKSRERRGGEKKNRFR